MTEADDVGIVHRAIAGRDGSGTAVECDIDGSDLPPLVARGAAVFVTLNIILNNQFRKAEVSCSNTRYVITPPTTSTITACDCKEPSTKITKPSYFIFNQDFWFVRIMAFAPLPSRARYQKATQQCHSERENNVRG